MHGWRGKRDGEQSFTTATAPKGSLAFRVILAIRSQKPAVGVFEGQGEGIQFSIGRRKHLLSGLQQWKARAEKEKCWPYSVISNWKLRGSPRGTEEEHAQHQISLPKTFPLTGSLFWLAFSYIHRWGEAGTFSI